MQVLTATIVVPINNDTKMLTKLGAVQAALGDVEAVLGELVGEGVELTMKIHNRRDPKG